MPKSVASYVSQASSLRDNNNNNNSENDDPDGEPGHSSDELDVAQQEAFRNTLLNSFHSKTAPTSPVHSRAPTGSNPYFRSDHASTSRTSVADPPPDEQSVLLHPRRQYVSSSAYGTLLSATAPGSPRPMLSRSHSNLTSVRMRNHSRRGSFGTRLARALGGDASQTQDDMETSKASLFHDDRMWYDQFTSTDWVHDGIADAYRVKALRARKDFKGKLLATLDGAQGWLLVMIIGIVTAAFAYFIDVTEMAIFDYKTGYCGTTWYHGKRQCCQGASICDDWHRWSDVIPLPGMDNRFVNYVAFCTWVVVLALASCLITLQTKTVISSVVSLSTLDENLAADHHKTHARDHDDHKGSPDRDYREALKRPPVVFYPAAGSGVAEVKVILSGFVLHGYLGVRTLFFKTFGLILSVASGLSLGKEGPYVHVATCVGNILCRLFPKYRDNDGKRREVLSASAAAGVAVAFGAPIGGVLFSLEEVSYYFPPKTLFRTFFCCIAAALSLRFFNPYGTNKIVLFEVRYMIDWKIFEIFVFILLGVLGGLMGALFIKASRLWAKSFRRLSVIKNHPVFEVFLVALATGMASFWNRYARLPVAELLYELAAPCSSFTDTGTSLCPTEERIPDVIAYLSIAFVIKAMLTTVTFGIKVPAGIYVPSMVVGGLLGRIVGHTVQYLVLAYPNVGLWSTCSNDGNPESCVIPGVYALVAAGATMCGVTRLSVTLSVILFELTGSLEHVLPFSLGVLVAKWTADALEPLSIYDLLNDMNAYPYLDTKARPVFTTDLGDITPKVNSARVIDISVSPLIPATHLRAKLEYLHMAGEIDGGVPILRDNILVGLIPGPDLEFALDRLESEQNTLCFMDPHDRAGRPVNVPEDVVTEDDLEDAPEGQPLAGVDAKDPTNFTPYIDPSPVSLDICSPMDLVFECFVKLGLRYICVLKEGRFTGLVHKKAFVKYVKECLEKEG